MFTTLMVPILCLPTVTGSDLTPDLMNWTVVVWGGPMLLAIIWFVVDAHKWFKGPRVNVEHMMIGQEGNVLEGKMENASEDSGSPERVLAEDGKVAKLA